MTARHPSAAPPSLEAMVLELNRKIDALTDKVDHLASGRTRRGKRHLSDERTGIVLSSIFKHVGDKSFTTADLCESAGFPEHQELRDTLAAAFGDVGIETTNRKIGAFLSRLAESRAVVDGLRVEKSDGPKIYNAVIWRVVPVVT